MDVNNHHNQSYWFVVREDDSNIIYGSNNFTIQNPQITGQEARYVVDTAHNRQYIQVDGSVIVQEDVSQNCLKDNSETSKDGEVFWDRIKIKQLLGLCQDSRFKSDTNEMLWNEVAMLVGTTPEDCDKKYRNLRRTYVRLLKKKRLGNKIKWVHFNLCEDVFKDCKTISPAILEPWEDAKVRKLLSLYIDNLNKFRNSGCLQKHLWKDIGAELNTTGYNCYHKFKNLKRTYLNLVDKSRESGKLIKWPYHQYFERIFYNYNPDVGTWDKNRIKLLLNAYGEIAHKFRNPKCQKRELWREIAKNVGVISSKCDRKFRNLKQTYIRLKMKADSGISITNWRYYKDFVSIYEKDPLIITDDGQIHKSLEQDYVKLLLQFYVENKERFKDPLVKKRHLWRKISPKLGLSPEECDKKFRNLKQTYMRLAEKKLDTGKSSRWQYYTYFEQIYGDTEILKKESDRHCNLGDFTLSEIKTIVNARENSEKDKFERFIGALQESNNLQRERNRILKALLDHKT